MQWPKILVHVNLTRPLFSTGIITTSPGLQVFSGMIILLLLLEMLASVSLNQSSLLIISLQHLNFEMDQQGMKDQLMALHVLVKFLDPELCNYLGQSLLFTISIIYVFLTGHSGFFTNTDFTLGLFHMKS